MRQTADCCTPQVLSNGQKTREQTNTLLNCRRRVFLQAKVVTVSHKFYFKCGKVLLQHVPAHVQIAWQYTEETPLCITTELFKMYYIIDFLWQIVSMMMAFSKWAETYRSTILQRLKNSWDWLLLPLLLCSTSQGVAPVKEEYFFR